MTTLMFAEDIILTIKIMLDLTLNAHKVKYCGVKLDLIVYFLYTENMWIKGQVKLSLTAMAENTRDQQVSLLRHMS